MSHTDKPIISRADAKALGIKHYFTGKPCRNGHTCHRLTSNANCLSCVSDNHKKHPERIAKQKKDYLLSPKGRNLHKVSCYKYRLKRYDLTPVTYEAKLASQGNKCACCSDAFTFDDSRKNTYPCVDHNHSTNKVRDILCRGCNTAIGHAKEDVQRLKSMIQYIRRHNV